MAKNLFIAFKKYQAKDVTNVDEFLQKYYKQDRLEYTKDAVRLRMLADISLEGYTLISRHDSVTGEVVTFYDIPKCVEMKKGEIKNLETQLIDRVQALSDIQDEIDSIEMNLQELQEEYEILENGGNDEQ